MTMGTGKDKLILQDDEDLFHIFKALLCSLKLEFTLVVFCIESDRYQMEKSFSCSTLYEALYSFSLFSFGGLSI